jgi:hypothetical protein
MVTDEQLIEYLRASMRVSAADVFVPPGLLDDLSPSRWRRIGVPGAGGLLAGLSTAAAVAVAVLLVVLLGHTHIAATQRVAPAVSQPAGPTSLTELHSALAILRSPQRAADRLPAWGVSAEQRPNCSNCLNVAALLPAQSRLLTTIAPTESSAGAPRGTGRRERVYLVLGSVPAAWQHGFTSGWHQKGDAARGLHLSLVGLATRRAHVAQPTDLLLNSAQLPMPAAALTPRDVLITSSETVGVVPDGVTRVKWELANPGQRTPVAVHPTIHGNVATAPWTPAPASTRLLNEQLLISATWYGPHGQLIARSTGSLRQIGGAYGAKPKP